MVINTHSQASAAVEVLEDRKNLEGYTPVRELLKSQSGKPKETSKEESEKPAQDTPIDNEQASSFYFAVEEIKATANLMHRGCPV